MTDDHPRGVTSRRQIIVVVFLVFGVAALAFSAAPVTYWLIVDTPRWNELWKAVAIPYGAASAGLAAVLAASLTYLNGQNQLHHAEAALEQARDEAVQRDEQARAELDQARQDTDRRDSQARNELDHSKVDADRRYDAELVRDLRARFTTASAQLGDPTTTIQQAGAYALASLADDWLTRDNTQEAQVCVDVLCTYLRTHHLTNTTPDHYDHTTPPPDQPVRDSVVRIIRNHLLDSPTGRSWSTLTYDFTGAHLHNADFTNSMWKFGPDFTGALFSDATFLDKADFSNATFGNRAWFDCATFGREASFDEASFGAWASFGRASFGDAVSFEKVSFWPGNARFGGTKFGDRASFTMAWFGDAVSFSTATFGDEASFAGATFGDMARFDRTKFGNGAKFWKATFGDKARFALATFGDQVAFGGTRIMGGRGFGAGVKFHIDSGNLAALRGATFGDNATFVKAKFGDQTGFFGSKFGSGATFNGATFGDEARFDATTFGDSARFDAVKFGQTPPNRPAGVAAEDWPLPDADPPSTAVD